MQPLTMSSPFGPVGTAPWFTRTPESHCDNNRCARATPTETSAYPHLAVWAHRLAESLLADVCPTHWERVQRVVARTRCIGRVLLEPVEQQTLEAAAWLHYIGYAPELTRSGYYPLDGALYLLERTDFPRRLCGLVAHHSSAVSEAVVRGLGDQLGDFIDERSLLRDVLWHCAAPGDGHGEPIAFHARLGELSEAFGQAHPAVLALTDRYRHVQIASARVMSTLSSHSLGRANHPHRESLPFPRQKDGVRSWTSDQQSSPVL